MMKKYYGITRKPYFYEIEQSYNFGMSIVPKTKNVSVRQNEQNANLLHYIQETTFVVVKSMNITFKNKCKCYGESIFYNCGTPGFIE